MDKARRIKVADFGTGLIANIRKEQSAPWRSGRKDVSATVDTISLERSLSKGVGTLLWMAPEALQGERIREGQAPKLDVYSFAIVLWEVCKHRVRLLRTMLLTSSSADLGAVSTVGRNSGKWGSFSGQTRGGGGSWRAPATPSKCISGSARVQGTHGAVLGIIPRQAPTIPHHRRAVDPDGAQVAQQCLFLHFVRNWRRCEL